MIYLGVDGGGTGCRARAEDAAGRVLGQARGGPANIATDLAGAVAVLRDTMARALPPGTDPGRVTAVLGLAGANLPDRAAACRTALGWPHLRLVQDVVPAVAGALRGAAGLVAVLGTGSVFARQDGAGLHLSGGWGLALGDEGSGAWIGRAALARALRATDGRVPMTPVLAGLLADLGGPAGAVAFAAAARPADLAALAPRILRADDPGAAAVLAAAVAEVEAALTDLARGRDLPLVLLGGLAAAYAPHLARWRQRPPQGSALDGAVWMARGQA